MIIKKILSLSLLSTALFASEKENNFPNTESTGRPSQFEISLNIGAADLKNAMASRFPSLFAGRSESAMVPLSLARKSIKKIGSSQPQIIVPEAAPILNWVAGEMTKMVDAHPEVQFLVDEIKGDLKSGIVDLGKIYGYGFRVLGAISDEPTQDALSLFKQFEGDQVDRDIRNNWQSQFSILALDDNTITSSYSTSNVSERIRNLLEDEVFRRGRLSMHYPLFGKGKLGLTMLIESFINRLYPIPVQDKQLTAHGIPMTPLLLAYHDYLHGKGDESIKESAFYNAIYGKMANLTQDKLDADQFVVPLAEFMISKAHLIEDTLAELLDLYFTHYLPDNKMMNLKKAMVGFFELMHEDFNISPEIYKQSNFDEILATFLGRTEGVNLKSKAFKSSVADATDLLKTDPVTGKPNLSSEEILDAIFDSGIVAKEQNFYSSPEWLLKRADLEGKKFRLDVDDNPLFTTVTLKLPGAVEYNWTVETLKYQLSSASDSLGLLRIAGIKMTTPTVSDLQSENGREVALGFLAEVKQNLSICRDAFISSAHDLIGLVPNGESRSLWKKFWDKSQKLNKKLEAAARIQ